jgi:hypothetical protein
VSYNGGAESLGVRVQAAFNDANRNGELESNRGTSTYYTSKNGIRIIKIKAPAYQAKQNESAEESQSCA